MKTANVFSKKKITSTYISKQSQLMQKKAGIKSKNQIPKVQSIEIAKINPLSITPRNFFAELFCKSLDVFSTDFMHDRIQPPVQIREPVCT